MKFLTPLLLLGLGIGILYVYVRPQYAEIQNKRTQIAQYDLALQKANEFQQERDRLIAELNALQQTDLERAEKMVPDSIDATKLVLEINEIAKRYGASIESIRIADQAQTEQTASRAFNIVTLGFNVKMTYDNLMSFAAELEENLRLVDISAITVNPSESADGRYGADITLSTYSLKPVN